MNRLALLYAAAMIMVGATCHGLSQSDARWVNLPESAESGDIVFLRSDNFRSRLVGLLRLGRDEFAHVGLVVRDEAGHSWIIHSKPRSDNMFGHDGVIVEPWDTFVIRGRVAGLRLFRVRTDNGAIGSAVEIARDLAQSGIEFDHEFDRTESERLYCTEFVELVFEAAGVNLVPADISSDQILYPATLMAAPLLIPIASDERP